MAKLTVTVAVFLFIFALAQARAPLDLQADKVIAQDLSTDEQESADTKLTTTILLPSEKLESEPEAVEEVAQPAEKTEFQKPESETDDDFIPLTVTNFHPINRHFPRNPSLTLRHRRPCRHHRPGQPFQFRHREISYGNDMLMSKGENKKEISQIPARWVKFHHGDTDGPKFSYWRDVEAVKGDGFRRPLHHRHQHFHHRHEEEDRERKGREHETGFLMKIRKFLNQF